MYVNVNGVWLWSKEEFIIIISPWVCGFMASRFNFDPLKKLCELSVEVSKYLLCKTLVLSTFQVMLLSYLHSNFAPMDHCHSLILPS